MNMLLWGKDVSGPEHDATFEMLKDAGFEGWISIEAFGGPAAGIWRRNFTSEEQLARDGAAFIGARL